LEYGKTAKSSLRNLEDAYYHLIANLCRDLRVEQGAFFDVLNGELHCLGRYNLSKMQFESSAFSHCRKWLHKEAASSQISRREGRESHMACIPVSREGKHFLIYLASTYFTKEIDELSNAVLRAAADSFSQNLHLAENSIPQSHGVAASHAGELVILPQSDTGALLTRDTAMLQLLQKSEQIAVTDASVLIFGETGVGKELLARHLHKHSGRTGPFVSVHPASMTETLFESTFFGHEKGSFTGATSQKIGFFELAHRGTLFIDEIGEMPLSMQTKFLRVLQERSFIRVGGLREIGSDFRLLTATNRDLGKEIAVGNFRQDLFYRISVVPLHMPPLRMRGGDAVLLAQSFLSFFARKYHRENVSLNKSDLLKIASYPWPGNVRELENVIERAVILHKEGPLELSMYISKGESREKSCNTPPSADIISDWPSLEELERRYIKLVLAHADGKVYGDNSAEAVLGIGRSTLYSKIRKFGFKVRRHYD
jgi:transcriptional regulator with GAF, ATPase, and Fis domain